MIQLRHPTRGSLAAFALATTLVACASGPETPAQPREKGEYVTGSNIPRKSGSTGANKIDTLSGDDLRKAGAAPAR